ncbi:MAG: hypothetical protein Cons2KO_04970 [Congregibacter sp.]
MHTRINSMHSDIVMSSYRAKRRQKKRAIIGAAAGIPLLIVIAYAVSSNDAAQKTRPDSVVSSSSALVERAGNKAVEGISSIAVSLPTAVHREDRFAEVSAELLAGLTEDEETALGDLRLRAQAPGSNDRLLDEHNDLAVLGSPNFSRGFRGGAGFINNHRAMRSAGRHSGSRFGGLGSGVGASGFGGAFTGLAGFNPQERTLGLGAAFGPLDVPLNGDASGSVFEDIFDDAFKDNSVTGLPFFPWEDPCEKDGLVVSPCFRPDVDPCAGAGKGELVVSPCYFAPAATLLTALDPPGSPPSPFVPFFNPPPPSNPPGDNPPPRNPPTPNDPPGPYDPPGPGDEPSTPVPLPGSAFLVGLGLAILRSKRSV